MTLDPHEFIRRLLMHVLPQGFHRIRQVPLQLLTILDFFGSGPRIGLAAAGRPHLEKGQRRDRTGLIRGHAPARPPTPIQARVPAPFRVSGPF